MAQNVKFSAARTKRVKTAPYGFWKSPITSDLIVAQSIGLSEVRFDGDDIYWLESRPAGRRPVSCRPVRFVEFFERRRDSPGVQCPDARP